MPPESSHTTIVVHGFELKLVLIVQVVFKYAFYCSELACSLNSSDFLSHLAGTLQVPER